MGKDLQGNELGKGFSQRKNGTYLFKKYKNRKEISIYNRDLDALRKQSQDELLLTEMFAKAKKRIYDFRNSGNEVQYVYFISDGQYVKIGYTRDLDQRLRELQVGSPRKLEIIRLIATRHPEALEKILHELFKNCHINGERYNIPIDLIKDK